MPCLDLAQAAEGGATLRVVIAATDSTLRLHLRRLLAGLAGCDILASARLDGSLQESLQRQAPAVVLIDGRADLPGAAAAVSLVLRHKARPVVLRDAAAPPGTAGLAGATVLPCPAALGQEGPQGEFARQLAQALQPGARRPPAPRPALARLATRPEVIAFGSSTGGPPALVAVFRALSRSIRQPMLLTQHMPAGFTTMLAQQISRDGPPACEAASGMVLQPGHVYVAPGGQHLVLGREADRLVCQLDDSPAEHFCKPAVDVMLRSVAQVCGGRALAVILTGMGHDGLQGCRALVAAGGAVLAQDEASSVVWGMPGAVAQAGLCRAVLPLGGLAEAINTLVVG